MTVPRPWRVASIVVPLSAACAAAQSVTPTDPPFAPGLYETETRDTARDGARSRRVECLASADFAAFQREAIDRFRALPQFRQACRLSDPKRTVDGFALAMDCGTARSIITYHFAKDLVGSVTETKVPGRAEYGSSIRTLSRRVGDCKRGGALEMPKRRDG